MSRRFHLRSWALFCVALATASVPLAVRAADDLPDNTPAFRKDTYGEDLPYSNPEWTGASTTARCYAEGRVIERRDRAVRIRLEEGEVRTFALAPRVSFTGVVLTRPVDLVPGMAIGIEYVPESPAPEITRVEFAPLSWPEGCGGAD